MFGTFGKLLAGIGAAGVLAGVLATGAFAAQSASTAASPAAKHREAKDLFRGTVTAVSETSLTVRNRAGERKTFTRTEKTQVFKGRHEAASWSEIEVNSHVAVRFAEQDGKLIAKRVHIGRAHVAGKVESVSGNLITIQTRDGKEVAITVTDATRYFEGRKPNRKPASLAELKPGQRLVAAGSWDRSGRFDGAVVLFWAQDGQR